MNPLASTIDPSSTMSALCSMFCREGLSQSRPSRAASEACATRLTVELTNQPRLHPHRASIVMQKRQLGCCNTDRATVQLLAPLSGAAGALARPWHRLTQPIPPASEHRDRAAKGLTASTGLVEFNPAQVAAYRLLGYENRIAAQGFSAHDADRAEFYALFHAARGMM
jgi:Domain of unknown function (DUF3520)